MASIFTKKGRLIPQWSRIGRALSGSLTILMGLIGYLLIFWGKLLPRIVHFLLGRLDLLLGGAVLGLIIFLFLSGGFGASSSKRKTDDILPKPQT